jgi:hypothetical protein
LQLDDYSIEARAKFVKEFIAIKNLQEEIKEEIKEEKNKEKKKEKKGLSNH